LPMCLKNKLLSQIKRDLPTDESSESVWIPRKKARESRNEGKQDTKFEWSVFSKISETLAKHKFKGMRLNEQTKKAWFCKYIGESSVDDGGLFRDSMTEMCEELQSSCLDLFIPCGN